MSASSLDHEDVHNQSSHTVGGLSVGARSSHVPGAVGPIKIKKLSRIYDGAIKFPKLHECAHFHYEFVAPRLRIQVGRWGNGHKEEHICLLRHSIILFMCHYVSR